MRLGGVDVEEGRDGEGCAGGDQVMRGLRRSCEVGRGMLRSSSKEERHRIWRRAPERWATCEAVGDGTERDVAGVGQLLRAGNRGEREGAHI